MCDCEFLRSTSGCAACNKTREYCGNSHGYADCYIFCHGCVAKAGALQENREDKERQHNEQEWAQEALRVVSFKKQRFEKTEKERTLEFAIDKLGSYVATLAGLVASGGILELASMLSGFGEQIKFQLKSGQQRIRDDFFASNERTGDLVYIEYTSSTTQAAGSVPVFSGSTYTCSIVGALTHIKAENNRSFHTYRELFTRKAISEIQRIFGQ